MPSVRKWSRTLQQTSTFQIILCVILFHSFASILIIYIHLSWFFSDEKRLWKLHEEYNYSKRDTIFWNMHSTFNVLSSKVISSDELSLSGWWMDHARWDTDIKCSSQRWKLCSKGFSSSCKTDGTRAIYQYIVFDKNSMINKLDISVTATADQLESQAVGATFGALALIKLIDGRTDTVQIQFSSTIEPLTTQTGSFSSGTSFVHSVTLMLMCYGYSGSVHFTDPAVIPHAVSNDSPKILANPCFLEVPKPESKHSINRLEDILVANNHSSKDPNNLVTLVTQVSMDRLSALERSLQLWEGPVSLVIYITTKHGDNSEYEWQRLYIQKKLKNTKLSSSSHVTLAFGYSGTDYPINALRNIAIRNVKTKFMFLLDADFQPSPDFQHKFFASVKSLNLNSKLAFVVPAFQYMELPQRGDNAPQTKEELLQLLHREEPFISPFRISESSESHKVTDYWKWYRADKLYNISTFCDKYEPYIIIGKTDYVPYYDERFSGYGMNKVTHITELFAAKYTFIVLPDLWVLHLPHKISPFAVEFLQNPHQRLQNRVERFEFIADVMTKYKTGNCES